MPYEIRHATQPNTVFAAGFFARSSAQEWIDEQRTMMAAGRHIWTDKTLSADDFVITKQQ